MTQPIEPIEYLDREPEGEWWVLDVLRKESRKWDWSVTLIDIDPDQMETCTLPSPLFLYVHPAKYRPGDRVVKHCYVSIPGKHRTRDAAWDAMEKMLSTQH